MLIELQANENETHQFSLLVGVGGYLEYVPHTIRIAVRDLQLELPLKSARTFRK